MAASNVSSDELLNKVSGNTDALSSLTARSESEEEVLKVVDLSVKCRGCFAEDSEMHYLFTPFHQDVRLADILMQTTTYTCEEDDGLPPYLCMKCTSTVVDFFNFKIVYQKTDEYIKNLLSEDCGATDPVKHQEGGTDFYLESNVCDETGSISCTETSDAASNTLKNIVVASENVCEFCQEEFMESRDCDTHMAKNHGKNPFLKYHLFRQTIVENEKAQVKERRLKRNLEADLKIQTLMNTPGKMCRVCRKKFSEEEFLDHWDTHKIHACDKCGNRYIKKSDLQTHIQAVHMNLRMFKCSLCDKSYKTKPLLKRHQVLHFNPRSYCCEKCGQRFNDSGTLKTHVRLKHIGNRDFVCALCGLTFPMKATLDKHILRHNKNRPPSFYCDICASPFKDKSSLKRHYLIKHTEEYVRPVCEHCGKTYCSNTKLRKHIEKHHSATGAIKQEIENGEVEVGMAYRDYSSDDSMASEANSETEDDDDEDNDDMDEEEEDDDFEEKAGNREEVPSTENVNVQVFEMPLLRCASVEAEAEGNTEYIIYNKGEYDPELGTDSDMFQSE